MTVISPLPPGGAGDADPMRAVTDVVNEVYRESEQGL